MKSYIKLALIGLAAVPVLAAAQVTDNLYIPTQLPHFDIDGVGGGGPFLGELLNPSNNSLITDVFLYCDSIPQEFYLGETFPVQVDPLNCQGTPSLDPWVIANANSQATLWDAANIGQTLDETEIQSAIQGVIWDLDGQLTYTGTTVMTSGDANTASFANFLYTQALTPGIGSYCVPGFFRFDAGPNYANNSGVLGQSQIGYPTPEPSALLGLAVPAVGFALRRRRAKKS